MDVTVEKNVSQLLNNENLDDLALAAFDAFFNDTNPDEETALHLSRQGNTLLIEQQFPPNSSLLRQDLFDNFKELLRTQVYGHTRIEYRGFSSAFPFRKLNTSKARSSLKGLFKDLGLQILSIDFPEIALTNEDPTRTTVCVATIAKDPGQHLNEKNILTGIEEFERRWSGCNLNLIIRTVDHFALSNNTKSQIKEKFGDSAKYITKDNLNALSMIISPLLLGGLPKRVYHQRPIAADGYAIDSKNILIQEDIITIERVKGELRLHISMPDLIYPYQRKILKNNGYTNKNTSIRQSKGSRFRQGYDSTSITVSVELTKTGFLAGLPHRRMIHFNQQLVVGQAEQQLTTGRRKAYRQVKKLLNCDTDEKLVQECMKIHSEAVRDFLLKREYPYITVHTDSNEAQIKPLSEELLRKYNLTWPSSAKELIEITKILRKNNDWMLLNQVILQTIDESNFQVCGDGPVTLKGERLMFRGMINSILLAYAFSGTPVNKLPESLKELARNQGKINHRSLEKWIFNFINEWKDANFLRSSIHLLRQNRKSIYVSAENCRIYRNGNTHNSSKFDMITESNNHKIPIIIRGVDRLPALNEDICFILDAIDATQNRLIATFLGYKTKHAKTKFS